MALYLQWKGRLLERRGYRMNERSLFGQLHPIINICYLFLALFVTMITMNPVLICLSFVISLLYSSYLEGGFQVKRFFFLSLPIIFFSVVILPLFYHNGVTPLFYINDMQVTLEAVIYGVMMTLLLLAAIQWFFIWNIWIDSEKFIYIFGRISPTLALVMSMALRMIPLLVKRWREIHEAQIGMGMVKKGGFVTNAGQFLKEISILISWVLENSLDTSISMESRGYGIGKRTSFHRFKWHTYETVVLIVMLILAVPIIFLLLNGRYEFLYYPVFIVKPFYGEETAAVIFYLCMLLFPMVTDVIAGHITHLKERT